MAISPTRCQQLTRTLQVLQAIQARPCTLHALAREFGVADRTIRRDMEALEAARFPIYSERGDSGEVRWQLLPTASLPVRRAA